MQTFLLILALIWFLFFTVFGNLVMISAIKRGESHVGFISKPMIFLDVIVTAYLIYRLVELF